MKRTCFYLILICSFAFISKGIHAQAYRAAATDALENDGKEWIEKKLPPSVITYEDFPGQLSIKTMMTTLAPIENDSLSASSGNIEGNFSMTIEPDQVPEQIAAARQITTTGTLTLNKVSKKITAQYMLEPRNSAEGFTISIIMRFNPADFNLREKDEPLNEPLIVTINGGYLNKHANNF